RRVVVNAHSGVANARIGKLGNEFAEESSTTINERLFDFIGQRIRIGRRTLQMIGDLHCTVVMDRESVEPALKIEKNRKHRWFKAARDFSRRFEVNQFLPRGREFVSEK